MVTRLLDLGASPHRADTYGRTALFLAAAAPSPDPTQLECASESICRQLLARGADCGALTSWGATPLLAAAEAGHHAALAVMLTHLRDGQGDQEGEGQGERLWQVLDTANLDGYTATSAACKVCKPGGLSWGEGCLRCGGRSVTGARLVWVQEGRVECVRLLLEFGADPSGVCATPCFQAQGRGQRAGMARGRSCCG
jgi:hypothetical protein